MPPNTAFAFTQSQATAYRRLRAMAEAQFSTDLPNCRVVPRFTALVIGPTGVGKTTLASRIAASTAATFIRVAFGDWVPIGAKDAIPTQLAILQALAQSRRVVVLIDELDKATGECASIWSRSVLAEVYATLDRLLPLDTFLIADSSPPIERDELAQRVASNLWIVGAGTWQVLFDAKPALGFAPDPPANPESIPERVYQSGSLPKELLMRFHFPPVLLQYPGQAETEHLFAKSGLTALATEVGIALDPTHHDWTRGGLRTLENLAACLLLRQRELAFQLIPSFTPLDLSTL